MKSMMPHGITGLEKVNTLGTDIFMYELQAGYRLDGDP
jgi:hypothetical protein